MKLQKKTPQKGGDKILTKDLLITKKNYPEIEPEFADLKEDIEIARKILRIYKNNNEEPYHKIENSIKKLEKHSNFKMIRGLNKILKRRTNLQQKFKNPKKLRSYLYKSGPVLNSKKRDKILKTALKKFDINCEENISEIIWSDREKNQILKEFDWISPVELLKEYNLSLLQTLIFQSTGLEFTIEDNLQQVFRKIKYLGLMYEIESEKPKIYVNGPTSLFKKTRKYGTSLAKLIPTIMKSSSWKINADIDMNRNNSNKIYKFSIDSTKQNLFPEKKLEIDKETKFDSKTERKFYKEFKFLKKDWKISREPKVVKSNSYAFIPDFGFSKSNLKYYLEIVGFWTDEYLKNKINKIKNSEINMAIAVDQNLKCTKEDFGDNKKVFFYKKKVPVKPIIKKLSELEKKSQNKIKKSKKDEIKTTIQKLEKEGKSKINLKELSKKLAIEEFKLKKINYNKYKYQKIGNYLIKQKILDEVKEEILKLNGIKNEGIEYTKVEKILKENDLYSIDVKILNQIGFKINWKSLDKKDSKVYYNKKRKNNNNLT